MTAPGARDGYTSVWPYLAPLHDTSFGGHRDTFGDPWGCQWWGGPRHEPLMRLVGTVDRAS